MIAKPTQLLTAVLATLLGASAYAADRTPNVLVRATGDGYRISVEDVRCVHRLVHLARGSQKERVRHYETQGRIYLDFTASGTKVRYLQLQKGYGDHEYHSMDLPGRLNSHVRGASVGLETIFNREPTEKFPARLRHALRINANNISFAEAHNLNQVVSGYDNPDRTISVCNVGPRVLASAERINRSLSRRAARRTIVSQNR